MSFRLNQRVAFMLLATAFLSITRRAHAADMFWSNSRGDGSGAFSSATNWSGGTPANPAPPNADDVAHFGMTELNVFPPKTYTVTFASDVTNDGIMVEDDRVTFAVNGRTFSTTGDFDNKIGTVAGQLGALTISNGTWNCIGVFDQVMVGAAASSSGVLTVSTGGRFTGQIVLSLGAVASGAGTLNVQNGGSVSTHRIAVGDDGPGAMNISSGGTVHSETVTNPSTRIGGISPAASGTVNVDGAGSAFTLAGDLLVAGDGQTGVLNIPAGGMVQSRKGIILGRGTVTVSGADSRWTNTDVVNVGGLNTGQPALLRLIDGAQMQATNTIVSAIGQVHGAGTITGSLDNSGIVAPGNSAGRLDITGNYTQSAGARLQIEIGGLTGGTQHDIMDAAGTAALGGRLELALLNGFAPTSANTFTILEASTVTGAFSNVASGQRLTTSDGLGSFRVNYGSGSPFSPSQVVLSAFQSSIVGDFDVDGDVDGRDFLIWQLGGSPNPGSAGDLAAWRGNFGFVSSAPGSAAVPEPKSRWLIAATACFACAYRRGQGVGQSSVLLGF